MPYFHGTLGAVLNPREALHASASLGFLVLALAGPRQQRSFYSISHLQFLQDVGHMMLDSFLAELQLSTDFLVAIPSRNPFENLPLPLGQIIETAR